jgi:methenyltetrahydrofolate cyclohydrolase
VQESIAARDQTIGTWLEALASATPAPGGGAAAALNAAVGAALIEMACNLTIGRPRYAEHEAAMRAVLAEATDLRNRAMRLAADDARAYDAVTQAYTLLRETDAQRPARTEQLQRALVAATEVPLETASVASDVIRLAGRLVDRANINALADVAAATLSARAALEAALISVEANLGTISDQDRVNEFIARMAAVSSLVADAEHAVRGIRSKITPVRAR